jgi:hypothetical protein
MLLSDAKLLRYAREFSKAEKILLGLATADQFLDQAVHSLGKLYRKALSSRDSTDRKLRQSGLSWPWFTALASRYTIAWEYFQSHKDPED